MTAGDKIKLRAELAGKAMGSETRRLKVLDRCIKELEFFLENEKDWDMDEMTQGAFMTAIESMQMRKERKVDE